MAAEPGIRHRVPGVMLLVFGVLATATGLYFMLVRPAMLPEDMKFTGVELSALPSRFTTSLAIVFATFGGFTIAFGVVAIGIAISLLTGRTRPIWIATATAIVIAMSRFVASNVILGSDFLWYVVVLAAVGAIAAASLVITSRARRTGD